MRSILICTSFMVSEMGTQQVQFLGKRVPNKWTFMAVHRRPQETGMFPSTFSLEHPHRQDKNTDGMAECSPYQSTRSISSQLAVPGKSVWQVLNFEGFYPYNIHHIQYLELRDYDTRLQFCRWVDAHLELCPLFLSLMKHNLLMMEWIMCITHIPGLQRIFMTLLYVISKTSFQ
jgi:hypothetical protein